MFQQFTTLLDRLQQADFLMLVLEPVFFYGVFFGLISFCVGFFSGDKRTRVTGLLIIAVSCFAVWPYLKLSQRAAPRIAAISGPWKDESGKTLTQRREHTRWVYYGTGCLALVALVAGGGSAKYIGGAVIAVGIGVIFFGVWLHLKEAEVFHPYVKRAGYAR